MTMTELWFAMPLAFRVQWWVLTDYGAACFHWSEL